MFSFALCLLAHPSVSTFSDTLKGSGHGKGSVASKATAVNKSAGVANTATYHSFSDEERIAFTEHINKCLAKDHHVGHRLPMPLESEQVSHR